MAKRRQARISPRKAPRQARSRQLVADILEGAVRVLRKQGARRFTTIRVAEEAGVSVGSLYQYFPNKEALLFRLQADEWEATWQELRLRLFAPGPPAARLRDAVRFFFESEAAEAELRTGLADASGLLREAHEALALWERARVELRRFVAEVAPAASRAKQAFAAELLFVTLGSVAERCTERRPDAKAVARWAEGTTDMLLAYLEGLSRQT